MIKKLQKSVMRGFDIHKKNVVQLKKTFRYKRKVRVFPLHLRKQEYVKTVMHKNKQTTICIWVRHTTQ